jgi:hypothetical protein
MKASAFSLVLLVTAFLTKGASAAVTFSVAFTAQALTDLSPADQAKFTGGLNFWASVITGYRDGVSRNFTLTVDTFSTAASGGGVLLGSAGPSALGFSNPVAGSGLGSGPEFVGDNDRFILALSGLASFNVHPDAGTLNTLTIRHEIGHALGIGTLWEDNEVYTDGVAGNSNRTATVGTPGQYFGAAALAAYQTEFNPAATFIPIERDGGPGTANGHWNEVTDNFGIENQAGFDSDPGDGQAAPTVLSGPNFGLSQDDELMTGVLSGSAFLSNTSIQSLYDIGFTVIPEPSTALLASLAAFACIRRRR